MAFPQHPYTDAVAYWQAQKIRTAAQLELALDHFCVLFAYHSGAIENAQITYHDTREIFENGKVINFTGDLRTLYEIANQKHCADYLMKKIADRAPVSEPLVLEIHRLLTQGTYDARRYAVQAERPGAYKQHDSVTGRCEVGAPAGEVPRRMQELIDEVHDAAPVSTENILKTAAYFHNVLESIHPFADGNGRVGRTMMNYILMMHDVPPIIIFDEDKKYYYAALEQFDESADLQPTVEFFKYEMEKTWAKTLDRAR